MDDWFELVLITFGAVLGAVFTYLGSIGFERRQKKRREREVASLLVSDLWWQLNRMKIISGFISGLIPILDSNVEESKQRIDNLLEFSSYTAKDIFSAMLPDLSQLPSETLKRVVAYYNNAEESLREVRRCLETRKLENLVAAKILAESNLNMGLEAYSYLLALEKHIEQDKARQAAVKALSQIEDSLPSDRLREFMVKMIIEGVQAGKTRQAQQKEEARDRGIGEK